MTKQKDFFISYDTQSGKRRVSGAVDHFVSGVEETENCLAIVDAGKKDEEPDVILNLLNH
jgi:hypothetical protein